MGPRELKLLASVAVEQTNRGLSGHGGEGGSSLGEDIEEFSSEAEGSPFVDAK